MSGRGKGAASERTRARDGRAGPRATRLPDRIAVAVPAGTRQAVERAAESDGMTPADWLRRLVRRGIDAARKRRERRGGK